MVVVIAGVLAVTARFSLIEPATLTHQCDALTAASNGIFAALQQTLQLGAWRCALRTATVITFAWFGLGYGAAICALLALITRNAVLSCAAAALGVAALTLYCYEPGAVALVLGVTLLAHAQARSSEAASSS